MTSVVGAAIGMHDGALVHCGRGPGLALAVAAFWYEIDAWLVVLFTGHSLGSDGTCVTVASVAPSHYLGAFGAFGGPSGADAPPAPLGPSTSSSSS